jgi:paraquat-inducible protein A
MGQNATVNCPLCGLVHRPLRLTAGETAKCTRCDAVLAKGKRIGGDAPLVYAVTGLILAAPAFFLPVISAGKFGAERISLIFTGIGAIWDNGMRALAVLVFLCGALFPVALLSALAVYQAPARIGGRLAGLSTVATFIRQLENWAIPEVQVLAILVALTKLGSVVDVHIGAGFWCYCGMAVCLLLAQRSFDFETFDRNRAGSQAVSPAPN